MSNAKLGKIIINACEKAWVSKGFTRPRSGCILYQYQSIYRRSLFTVNICITRYNLHKMSFMLVFTDINFRFILHERFSFFV